MRAKAKRRSVPPSSEPRVQRLQPNTRRLLMVLALLSITVLAFSNSFQAGFTLDNHGLLRDPRIEQATLQNAALIGGHSYWWPSGESGLYRPFTTFTYLFNYAILGNRDQPAGYHWINLLLHAANIVLVYVLMLRLTGQFWMSGFIAAIWAVHPVLTESVTNMVGRADLLAALATLSGFWMYLRSTETGGWRRAAWLLGLLAVTSIGVFSKESAVCVVGVIVLYELVWWKEHRRPQALVLGALATLVPIAAMLYLRSRVLAASLPPEFPFTDNPIVGTGFFNGRLTALSVIPRYLWLIVWPARLSCDYSYPQIPLARGTFADWAGWIAVACLVLLVAILYRRNRTVFFLMCFAAGTFLPMSNLLFPIGTIMAERFLYLPSIGLLASLVMLVYAAGERAGFARFVPLILCVMVAGFAARTWARNSDWESDLSITNASLKASPNSFKLHRELAELLFQAERTPENIERGNREAETSVALLDPLPDSKKIPDAYCLLGGYDLIEGDLRGQQAGRPEYEKAVQTLHRCADIDASMRLAYRYKLVPAPSSRNPNLKPAQGDPQPYMMLSIAYLRLNNVDEAIRSAATALRLHPRSPAAYGQIANVLLLQHQKDDAEAALTEGMLLTGDPEVARALLELYEIAPGSNGCAIVSTPTGARIDPHCAPIRTGVCAIAPQVIQARFESGRADLAEQQGKSFLEDYGCPVHDLGAF